MSKKNLLKADKYYLATFPTTHNALHAEKTMEESGLIFLVVPTPREISAGCGLSIRFFEESYKDILDKFKTGSIVYSSIFEASGGQFRSVFSPVTTD